MQTYEDIVIETFPIGSFACNCSIIYSSETKECVIIDPGNDYNGLNQIISDRKLRVKKILHTHAHFDHIGRSKELKDATGAPIYLHKGDLELYKALSQQAMFFGESVGEVSEVDYFLEDEQEISLYSKNLKGVLKTLHTPGHTPGSCCFYSDYFDTPLLFSGDTLFRGSIGRTDFPGGSYDQIISSLKNRLLILPEETNIISGHGPNSNIHTEKRTNPFLT